MNILMIYPKNPDSYWSFNHALKFIAKKASIPPLGLLTVSAILPKSWNKKLIDLNVKSLKNIDFGWPDYVFISAMNIQEESVLQIIEQCVKNNVKIVAGGPLFTQDYANYPQIDHLVLNEAEITLPLFLKDLNNGRAKRMYSTTEYADITKSPIPDFYLLNHKDYASMTIQISRGCPFACDFCEITTLLGHKVRMKSTAQLIEELETLYNLNWRSSISIVDDNFIGNTKRIKNDLLPELKKWMQEKKHPFVFNTQTTINLADDNELMELMTVSGFNSTFIGLETPSEESLHECNKKQNKNRNLIDSVRKIQMAGMQVAGGFIIGFDSDQPGIFQKQIDFIQNSGIVSAMVGILNAPRNTKLYKKLVKENRILSKFSGNNTDFSTNFKTKMDYEKLVKGYKEVIKSIYSVKPYYKRIRLFLNNYGQKQVRRNRNKMASLKALFRAILIIGLLNKGRREFWQFLFWTIIKRPSLFMDAMVFAVYGYHYRKVFNLT